MIKVEYSSNNSGGSWWLTDDNWRDLEKAGWTVEWYRDSEHSNGKERWLGSLARGASKEFETPRDAILEFEKITGADASDEGCNCCGPPHSFSWGGHDTPHEYNAVSGDSVADLLHGRGEYDGLTRRELMERLAKSEQE